MNWKDTDLAYLAGIADADGHFGIYGKDIGTARMVVTNCYRPTLEWIQATFGGTIHIQREAKGAHKECLVWRIGGKQAVPLLVALIPHLKEKQVRAQALVDLYKLPSYHGKGKVPEAVMAKRIKLQTIIKESINAMA